MKIDHPRQTDIPALKKLWQEAFGDTDAFLDSFFDTAFACERCLCVMEAECIRAAAYVLDCSYPSGKLAYIYAVATAKVARGRGYCHSLMAQLHRVLKARGYVGCILVPGEASLGDFYRGMGYEFFGGINVLSAQKGGSSTLLRKITGEEYAAMRRSLLPAGAVLQEGESLRFLQQQAQFAAGEEFILAYSLQQSQLWGIELLGSAAHADGILAALGADSGCFRRPGRMPFAMFRPLQDVPVPGYFGFAFD